MNALLVQLGIFTATMVALALWSIHRTRLTGNAKEPSVVTGACVVIHQLALEPAPAP